MSERQFTDRQLIVKLLDENLKALHPSRGKENARLVRLVCEEIGACEDDFLARHIKRDKKAWGLD
jgi:hypothetical protein